MPKARSKRGPKTSPKKMTKDTKQKHPSKQVSILSGLLRRPSLTQFSCPIPVVEEHRRLVLEDYRFSLRPNEQPKQNFMSNLGLKDANGIERTQRMNGYLKDWSKKKEEERRRTREKKTEDYPVVPLPLTSPSLLTHFLFSHPKERVDATEAALKTEFKYLCYKIENEEAFASKKLKKEIMEKTTNLPKDKFKDKKVSRFFKTAVHENWIFKRKRHQEIMKNKKEQEKYKSQKSIEKETEWKTRLMKVCKKSTRSEIEFMIPQVTYPVQVQVDWVDEQECHLCQEPIYVCDGQEYPSCSCKLLLNNKSNSND